MRRGVPREVVVGAVLGALQIVLSVAGVGALPLPANPVTGTVNVTILEIPAILAGVLGGPLAGAAVGAIFGGVTFFSATTPLFQNALIAIGPRVLIGVLAYAVHRGVRPANLALALVLAGAVGALANSGLVLLLAVLLRAPNGIPYLPANVAWDVARTSLPADAFVAAAITLVVGLVFGSARRKRR